MIEIYGVRMSMLPSHHVMSECLPTELYETWRMRHRGMRSENTSKSSLAGLYLLRHCMQEIELCYDEDGRPYSVGSTVDFSITHTNDLTLLALDRGGEGRSPRVGLDAEDLSRLASMRICPIAERWFSPKEYAAFLAEPTDDVFLQIWTRKEALVKWTGSGMRGLRHADTVRAGERYGVKFTEYRIDNMLVALCSAADAEPPHDVQLLSVSDLTALGLPEVEG